MGETRRSCKCRKNSQLATANSLPLIQICFLTTLSPDNTLDPTREGFVVVNWKDVTLGPIQEKCQICEQCRRHCLEQQCVTLMGHLRWTVSIPIFSSCAAIGNNTGFQSVSGSKNINHEVCGDDLSGFNVCNIPIKIVEIKVQPNPFPDGTNLGTLVGGIVANPPDPCDCTFSNGEKVTITNEFGNCQESCDNLVFNQM